MRELANTLKPEHDVPWKALRATVLALLILAGQATAAEEPGNGKPRHGSAQSDSDPADSVSPPRVVGTVEAFEGEVSIRRDVVQFPVRIGGDLYQEDTIVTSRPGKARAKLIDGSILAVGPASEVKISNLEIDDADRRGLVSVAVGSFWMQVRTWLGSGSSLVEVHTPNAVAGVRGTTLWGDTRRATVCSLEGLVEVRSLGEGAPPPVRLAAGRCAGSLDQGRLEPVTPSAEEVEAYLEEVLIPTR